MKDFLKIISENKTAFLLNFFIVCSITFGFLYMFGFVPEEFKLTVGRYKIGQYTKIQNGELPIRIVMKKVGLDSRIYNPNTNDIKILDSFLLKGVVRYPSSGFLGEEGNVFLFAHSTGIKIVNNEAFKAFNGLKNLKNGDLISVFSEKREYIYKVFSVRLVGADKELVDFDTSGKKLTLSTCNTFGAKIERYVVEAELYSIKNI